MSKIVLFTVLSSELTGQSKSLFFWNHGKKVFPENKRIESKKGRDGQKIGAWTFCESTHISPYFTRNHGERNQIAMWFTHPKIVFILLINIHINVFKTFFVVLQLIVCCGRKVRCELPLFHCLLDFVVTAFLKVGGFHLPKALNSPFTVNHGSFFLYQEKGYPEKLRISAHIFPGPSLIMLPLIHLVLLK